MGNNCLAPLWSDKNIPGFYVRTAPRLPILSFTLEAGGEVLSEMWKEDVMIMDHESSAAQAMEQVAIAGLLYFLRSSRT